MSFIYKFQLKCKLFHNLSFRVSSHKSVGTEKEVMKILNVAEKNDAAKNIAALLSGGNVLKREGLSKFNKIYEFKYNFRGQNMKMCMTSVSGHLLNYAFIGHYKKWTQCNPESLFEAPVVKECPDDSKNIKATLEREVKTSNILIIWTDCDREGENIGYEIISVCVQMKPNIQIYRAKFSEITNQSVKNAIENLDQLNKCISDAVDVRSELDLRIGASFTRFQTLRLKRVFPNILGDSLISYGSCQFPTLGFVVERYKAVQDFISEPFWKIKVLHVINELTVEFTWKRVRLFDRHLCQTLFEKCQEHSLAKVEKVETKPKSKWRPFPLDTIELEKTASRKLKINAKETMRIAERLYSQGYISYPRTETNIFPQNINLQNLVELHTEDNRWGQFAASVLQDGVNPKQGKKSDQAHPPIHPTKYTNSLSGNEARVYEYIVRHFLACLSKDAEGFETVVNLDVNNEKFVAHGLQIVALNYLEVYPYEKWNSKEIHAYKLGQTFTPTSVDMIEGETSAPNLLTEADLISLMDKHGIGTDATHAEHIEKIKQRVYVGLQDNIYFVPGELGIGLVDGYDSMGFEMSKPYLRAELETDLQRICEGTKDPNQVLTQQINNYREVFKKAVNQANKLDLALNKYFKTEVNHVENNLNSLLESLPEYVLKCSSCGLRMILKDRPNNPSYITCGGYPACRNSIWFPSKVVEVSLASDVCTQCGPEVRLLKFKFRPDSMAPFYANVYTGCIGGCDTQLLDMLEIRSPTYNHSGNTNYYNNVQRNNSSNDSSQHNGLVNQQFSQRTNNNPNYNQPNNSNEQSLETEDVNCNCGLAARRCIVQKDNVNKGRPFYCCPKPQVDSSKCNFFMWADRSVTSNNLQSRSVTSNNLQSFGNRNLTNNNRNSNFENRNITFRAKKRGTNSRTNTARKCGNCRQEGHTRNNCPLLQD